MATRTPVIDVQVHAYERNSPERPWVGFLQGPEEVTGDDMVAAMDAVGVDGALLVSPYSMYGYDASYALDVYAEHPGKFALIRPFDPESETIDDEMAEWTGTPGVVGARIMLARMDFGGDHAGLNRIMAAGGRAGVPVNVMASGKLDILRELASNNPDTVTVIDHVGLAQPFEPPAPPEPFADLDAVLSAGRARQRGDKDLRGVHAVAGAVSVRGHLGASSQDIRRLRDRAVHVGDGLDASGERADVRAGGRGVQGYGGAVGLGAVGANGWVADEDLQVVAGGGGVGSFETIED